MKYYLGVDGGGTKTLSVIVDETGRTAGIGIGGTGNFQTVGVEDACSQVKTSIDNALDAAGITPEQIRASYFGMAGADRPTDFQIVEDLLAPIAQSKTWAIENDAIIGVLAESRQLCGIGVVCGTGTNVVGLNLQGERIQVGGMGDLFGDRAGGSHIGKQAVALACRGRDGRGTPTILYDRFCKHYGVTDLIDLIDRLYRGENLKLSELVRYVVDAAIAGDEVATTILTDVGEEMGMGARAALRALFPDGQQAMVVAMGGVFQNARSPLMYDAFSHVIHSFNPDVQVKILRHEPVFGAIYGAVVSGEGTVDDTFVHNLESTFTGRPE